MGKIANDKQSDFSMLIQKYPINNSWYLSEKAEKY